MKPFLGLNITEDKTNTTYNGNEFLIQRPSTLSANAFEKATESADEIVSKAQFPFAVRAVHWICGAVGAVTLLGILKSLGAEDSVPLSVAYDNAGWIFWLCGICLAVWFVLTFLSRRKAKAVIGSEENERVASNLDSTSSNIFAELGVPSDAVAVDILSFSYKMKNDKIMLYSDKTTLTPYINYEFKAFKDSEYLYFVNLDGKYRIPLSSLCAIHTQKKNASIPMWNKDTPYNKGEYRQYKLTNDGYDNIHIKKQYILELQYSGESWGIYFPNYELPSLEALTGLKAE